MKLFKKPSSPEEYSREIVKEMMNTSKITL